MPEEFPEEIKEVMEILSKLEELKLSADATERYKKLKEWLDKCKKITPEDLNMLLK